MKRARTIALVRLTSAEELAESIAAAVGGRARAIQIIQAALDYLRRTP